MSENAQHLPDELILRLIDNELSEKNTGRAYEHLSTCQLCQNRLSALESASNDLLRLHHAELPHGNPDPIESRLRLQASLKRSRQNRIWPRHLLQAVSFRVIATAALAVLVVAVALRGMQQWRSWHVVPAAEARVLLPNRSLTPGAVRPITLAQVCSAGDGNLDPEVSPSVEQAVLGEYGIHPGNHAHHYQIDYLVNPQLGGTDDIKNLWPEPYANTKWNAHAKDELERRLHQMVCNRTVGLDVAQREIATDWIGAYKRYVRNNRS